MIDNTVLWMLGLGYVEQNQNVADLQNTCGDNSLQIYSVRTQYTMINRQATCMPIITLPSTLKLWTIIGRSRYTMKQ